MAHAGRIAAVLDCQQRRLIRHSAENQRRMNHVGMDQVAGGSDARVDGLNSLMGNGNVLPDHNVNMGVVQLTHGFGPLKKWQSV